MDADRSCPPTAESIMARAVREGPAAVAALIKSCGGKRAALRHWLLWADPRQLPPPGDWRSWLIMAGRGFGKTRAGAEWVHHLCSREPRRRFALVAATLDEARAVLVEGQSGLLSITPPAERPKWEPSRHRLVWRNGSEARLYSGESPERLRGPEHHYAWCDEIAKWSRPQASWDILQMGLRLGPRPRVLVTTTPRPISLLRALRDDPAVVVVQGATRDNRYLPPAFVAQMEAAYGGTRLGRQELLGELIDDVTGALWTRDLIERCRAGRLPRMRRVVVGVDPPASATGDACGIVVVGLGEDGLGYVLADHSIEAATPDRWARAVAAAAEAWGADRVVAEANNGGEMVAATLRAADIGLPLKLVHASRGKAARAEPVSSLFEGGRALFAGAFPALEDELCGLVAGGAYDGPGRSPDRADACVWALTELMLGKKGAEARVRVL